MISFSYYPGARKKALTMSYDNGQIHDRRLVDIFNQYRIKGTFHLNSGKFGKDPYLNSSEIKELLQGHEVSVHLVNHPLPTLIPREELVEEIVADRKTLENLVGYPVRGMSYPYGNYDDEVVKILPSLGMEYSRTIQSHGRFILPNNFLTWHPTCHHRDNLIEKCKQFQDFSSWFAMPLLYVWGHSYEFDQDNNWEVIEEFCKMAGNDESVWYATNIEIVDYLTALRSLKFSADRKLVFNPSALSVWVGVDGEACEIKPGETKYL